MIPSGRATFAWSKKITKADILVVKLTALVVPFYFFKSMCASAVKKRIKKVPVPGP